MWTASNCNITTTDTVETFCRCIVQIESPMRVYMRVNPDDDKFRKCGRETKAEAAAGRADSHWQYRERERPVKHVRDSEATCVYTILQQHESICRVLKSTDGWHWHSLFLRSTIYNAAAVVNPSPFEQVWHHDIAMRCNTIILTSEKFVRRLIREECNRQRTRTFVINIGMKPSRLHFSRLCFFEKYNQVHSCMIDLLSALWVWIIKEKRTSAMSWLIEF